MRKKLITFLLCCCLIAGNTVYANNMSMTASSQATSMNDTNVRVVKHIGNEQIVVYTGPISQYENGLCASVDFVNNSFAVFFAWDELDAVYYIFPIESDTQDGQITSRLPVETLNKSPISGENNTKEQSSLLVENNKVSIYQSSILKTTTENAEINVSLLYDNSYSETVLLPGEKLTAEFEVINNNTERSVVMSAIIALYDNNGKFLDMNVENLTVGANEKGEFYNSIVVPLEGSVANAKIMVWENMDSLRPYISPIILTLSGIDFFGDDYTVSQPLNKRNSASGMINTMDDTDVFEFTPLCSGLYYFETFSNIDTYASLYSENDLITALATSDNDGIDNNFKLYATLEQGTTYYLYINARTTGNYLLNVGYAIGNIFGTVTPIKLHKNNTEYNELIDTTVTLETYDTNEYVATMYLRNCSDSINDYSSFSITGVHSNDYLVKIKRPGYLTLYKRIQLMDNAIDLGSKVLVAGDVNDDNIISQDDLSLITSVMNSQYGDDNYLVSADLNSDMIINQSDYELANNNMGLNSNCYNENVNVITGNITQMDNSVLISGYAALESQVACVVFLDNINVFEELCEVDSNGYYEFQVELNKSGIYKISIGDENMEFVISETIDY